jgi:uncharacterized Fe-S cluster-containing radical SAM superfamily protein
MVQFIIKPASAYGNINDKLNGLACKVPFTYFEILTRGDMTACCFSWLPVEVGNILTDSTEDIINNVDRIRIQNNMKNSLFSDCNDQCPTLNSLLSFGRKTQNIVPIEELDNAIKKSPISIGFSYDRSCNLQCPSCRNDLIFYDPEDPTDINGQYIKTIHNKVKLLIDALLNQDHELILNITGSGDAFASALYWNYLLELAANPVSKNIKIILNTNGVLMTKENWYAIKSLWPNIIRVLVSVDAATEDTYKIVRKNGNFKKLQRNLIDFDELVDSKNFPNLINWQTNFILQRDNYKELKDFVAWQLTFKSKPSIWTSLITQWGHITNEEFTSMAVWQSTHLLYKELVEILKDPIFQNPQLNLGAMSALVNKEQNV